MIDCRKTSTRAHYLCYIVLQGSLLSGYRVSSILESDRARLCSQSGPEPQQAVYTAIQCTSVDHKPSAHYGYCMDIGKYTSAISKGYRILLKRYRIHCIQCMYRCQCLPVSLCASCEKEGSGFVLYGTVAFTEKKRVESSINTKPQAVFKKSFFLLGNCRLARSLSTRVVCITRSPADYLE